MLAARALSQKTPPATLNGVTLSQPVATLPDASASIANSGTTPLR